MAKIAVAMEEALVQRRTTGAPGQTSGRVLAQGAGWIVRDVVCTCGPQDRPFEEQHSLVSVAIVVAGTFQYRGATRDGPSCELMTPGSLLLGNYGQGFECEHQYGEGDRCTSFQYTPEYFESIAAGIPAISASSFRVLRLPPLRDLSRWIARACASVMESEKMKTRGAASPASVQLKWEELAAQIAAQALEFASGVGANGYAYSGAAIANVTAIVRAIESRPDLRYSLGGIAREAGLSPYHFLRVFERSTGVTPHQYILRTRLREAALRLALEPANVLDIALDCGFGDVSNFNHAFRAEFSCSPREFRRTEQGRLIM